MEVPTRQEMFDRAVRGLASQSWRQAVVTMPNNVTRCAYRVVETGDRCAWGWVDPDGPPAHHVGAVSDLRRAGIGIAAKLDSDMLSFASRLQECHDGAKEGKPDDMRYRFIEFAEDEDLVWPDDVVKPS